MKYSDIASLVDKKTIDYEGRISKIGKTVYLCYTNSYLRFWTNGTTVKAHILSNITETVDMAGLMIFVDDMETPVNEIVLDKDDAWYQLCTLDGKRHLVTIVKITEAQKSHAGFVNIEIADGDMDENVIWEKPELKLEFLGDSITCGYGVLGEPESEYTLRDEQGLLSYAHICTKLLNARGRYISASGFGVYVDYLKNTEDVVPKIYPYQNYFLNDDLCDFHEYEPDVTVINLGTNDSGHIGDAEVSEGFVNAYVNLIKTVRNAHQNTKIVCTIGTLCGIMFELIEKAIEIAKADGINDIFYIKLPYHDVENDGMASMHPSRITHEKDGKRLAEFIRKEIL